MPAARLALGVAAALLCGFVHPQGAWAQGASALPGSGATQDRTLVPAAPTAPKAAIDVGATPPAQAEVPAAEARTINVKSIVIEGNTVFDASTLLARAGGTQSGAMTIAKLRAIAAAITAYYRDQGYLVAQARLPAQDVTAGNVRILVIEGRLEAVASQADDPRVQQRVQEVLQANLKSSRETALKRAELERAVLLAGEITGAQTRASLAAGDQAGTTRASVEADPVRRFSGGAILNNDGLASTGRTQLVVGGVVRSLLDTGDSLSASLMTSERGSSLYGYNLQYDRFLGASGWYGGLRTWQSIYSLGGEFAASQASGRARSVGAHLGYALDRASTGRTRTDVRFGVTHTDLKDENIALRSQRQEDAFWADIGGEVNDQALGTPAVSRWRLGGTVGRLHYNSEDEAASDAAGLRRAGQFELLNYELRREQSIGSGFSVLGSLRGQAASKNLDSFNKFGLGGSNAVRAFGPDAPSGDIGYLTSFEIGHTSALDVLGSPGQLRIAAFYDYGKVRFNHSPLSTQTGNTASRAGYGLSVALTRRMANGRDMSLRAYVARSDRQHSTDLSGNTTRTSVELLYPF